MGFGMQLKAYVHNPTSEFRSAVLPYQQGIYKRASEKSNHPPLYSLSHITEFGGKWIPTLDPALDLDV